MDAECLPEDLPNAHPGPTGTAGTVSLKSRVLSGAIWISLEMIGVQATSFAVFATIAHFVTPRDFGLLSICFISIQSLQTLVFYNVPTVAIRKQEAANADFTTAFWIAIALSILAFLLLFELSGCAQRLFKAPGLKPVLQAMSFVLLFMGLSRTHEAWLTRHFKFRSLAIRGLFGAILGGITGVFLAVKGFGADALVAQQVVNSTITTTLLWIVCPWRPTMNFSWTVAREIFGFMRHITLNNLVYVVNQNCDVFLVALFFGPASTGFYNIGKRIRLALQLAAGDPIKNVMLPSLAEMQDEHDRLQAGMLRSFTLVCVICSPIFFGVSVISHDVILLIFGQKWVHAVPILRLLALSGLAIVLLGCNENVFILKHKPLYCLHVSLAYTILAVIALVITKQAHIVSLALPFVLPYIFVLPYSAWLVVRLTAVPIRAFMAAVLPGILSAAGMFLAVEFIMPHVQTIAPLPRVIVLSLSAAIIYAALLAIIWPGAIKFLLQTVSQLGRKRT